MLVLAKAFHDVFLGSITGFGLRLGCLEFIVFLEKRANYNGNFALHLQLVSAHPLQKVRNMTINRIKIVFVLRRCAAIRQKGFHVHC